MDTPVLGRHNDKTNIDKKTNQTSMRRRRRTTLLCKKMKRDAKGWNDKKFFYPSLLKENELEEKKMREKEMRCS